MGSIDSNDVISVFQTQAKIHSHVIALIDEQFEYTYAQLNERANQLANLLQEKAVKEGDFVALLLESVNSGIFDNHLSKSNIKAPVQSIFDLPMCSCGMQNSRRIIWD